MCEQYLAGGGGGVGGEHDIFQVSVSPVKIVMKRKSKKKNKSNNYIQTIMTKMHV